tara:strand:+ start:5171 stop:5593 length:423 start_codon:yes stop_codon:yes gene_type:complete
LNSNSQDKTLGQFEQSLIKFLAGQSAFNNSYDALASYLSERTGKNINGRKINFMARGDAYAQKWLKHELAISGLQFGWVPNSVYDWEAIVHLLTGKRQSIFAGDNSELYRQLADLSGKTEGVFAAAYQHMLEDSHYGKNI